MSTTTHTFSRFSRTVGSICGRPIAFGLAVISIVVWIATGPYFGYSDTWQLVINTSTTIITFLMVFLIQATQNRDTEALQLKLDELIRATGPATDTLIALEAVDDEEFARVRAHYLALAQAARAKAAHIELAVESLEVRNKRHHRGRPPKSL